MTANVSMSHADDTAKRALNRLHEQCVIHAQTAQNLTEELGRGVSPAVVSRARRMMLHARANLEQWRVAVVRASGLHESDRQTIQMVMRVARHDIDASYALVARSGEFASSDETLENALRRTRRAMIAVLLEIDQLRPSGEEVARLELEDLKRALTTRGAYARLALGVNSAEGPLDGRVVSALRLIGDLLDPVTGIPIRLSDRSILGAIQDRLCRWIEVPDERAGRELWSELVSVCALIRSINQREILRNHDRTLLTSLLVCADQGGVDSVLARWDDVMALRGLDSDLDFVLARPRAQLDAQDLDRTVARMRVLVALLGA